MSLRDELLTDPAARGYEAYVDLGNNAALVRLLNERLYAQVGARRISSAELLIWAAQDDRLGRLKAAIGDTALPSALRTIADAAVQVIERDGTEIDMSRPEIQQMVTALVQASVFTADDQSSLETLSTAQVSRAEIVLGRQVSLADVREALNAAA
jgi:hypothetical protein